MYGRGGWLGSVLLLLYSSRGTMWRRLAPVGDPLLAHPFSFPPLRSWARCHWILSGFNWERRADSSSSRQKKSLGGKGGEQVVSLKNLDLVTIQPPKLQQLQWMTTRWRLKCFFFSRFFFFSMSIRGGLTDPAIARRAAMRTTLKCASTRTIWRPSSNRTRSARIRMAAATSSLSGKRKWLGPGEAAWLELAIVNHSSSVSDDGAPHHLSNGNRAMVAIKKEMARGMVRRQQQRQNNGGDREICALPIEATVESVDVSHCPPSKRQRIVHHHHEDSTSLFCASIAGMLAELQPYHRERIKRDIYNLVSDALLTELSN